MKTRVMIVLFTLSFLSLFSTANAGVFFAHGMDGRAREVRFDRAERFGGERLAHDRAERAGFGREHERRDHELRAHDVREHEGRAGDARELRSAGSVHPLPYYTH